MSSSKIKKALLILGILIAVLIGVNAYGTTKLMINDDQHTLIVPSIEKFKNVFNKQVIEKIIIKK